MNEMPDVTWDEPRFQRWVVATARANGWRVRVMDVRSGGARLRRGHTPDRGWPDLLFVHPTAHRLFWAELKDAKAPLKAEQEEVIGLLRAAGQEVHVWRPQDWEVILERM